MKKDNKRKSAGVTYIEVILSVALFSYIALSFTQLMLNSIKSSKMSEYRTRACNAAVNWIEENRADYGSLRNSYPEWKVANRGEMSDGTEYVLYDRIRETVLAARARYKRIDVKVNWFEKGAEKEVFFSTIKAKYD